MTDASESFYRLHLFVCTNERPEGHPRGSCARAGAEDLLGYLKTQLIKRKVTAGVRAQKAGCLDRCELGPVLVVYPESTWYAVTSKTDIDQIIDQHVIGGQVVASLALRNDQTGKA